MTPLGFAHRGARADAPENTIGAFALALERGATGLETDVWLTADGVPVLHHGGALRRRGRAVPLGSLTRDQLPSWLPALADLYARCGTSYDLSLDLKDGLSAAAVLEVATTAGHDTRRLWLCGRGLAPLDWRHLDPGVRLVSDTRRRHVRDGWDAHLSRVAAGGGAAINLRRRRWSSALVAQVHAHGLLAFGWDAQSVRRLQALLAMGCDAVYCDHVRRMRQALDEHARRDAPGG